MDAILEKLNTPLILEDPDRCNHWLYPSIVEEVTGGTPGHLFSCSNCGYKMRYAPIWPEPAIIRVPMTKHYFHRVPREIDRWEWVLLGIVLIGAFLLGLMI